MLCLDRLYDPDHHVIRVVGIFPALQHDRPEAKTVTVRRTFGNLFGSQSVPLGIFVATSDTAVIAVVFAVVGKFYKASYIDLVAVVFPCN